jgi:DNA-binding beta-propeller fold protein YncE
LFASILRMRFSTDLDQITGTFRMTPEHQQVLGDGGEVQIGDGSGTMATVDVLTRLPISEPDPNTIYRFSNPWGLAASSDGSVLWAVDASTNALLRIDSATGRWQRLMRFPPMQNPGPVGPPVVDSVPTNVRTYGNELLVSFLTGFPFVPGTARVLTIDPAQRASQPFMLGLTSVVDVLWRDRGTSRAQFFVLEFSTNQSAQPAAPGRLLRFDTAAAEVVAADLRAPVSMALDEAAGFLYVLELSGRVLRLRL